MRTGTSPMVIRRARPASVAMAGVDLSAAAVAAVGGGRGWETGGHLAGRVIRGAPAARNVVSGMSAADAGRRAGSVRVGHRVSAGGVVSAPATVATVAGHAVTSRSRGWMLKFRSFRIAIVWRLWFAIFRPVGARSH